MGYRGVGLGPRCLHAGRAVVLQFAAQLFHFLICLSTSRAEGRFVLFGLLSGPGDALFG